MKKPEMNQEEIDQLKIDIFEGLIGELKAYSEREHRSSYSKGRYPFIPLSTDYFIKQLNFLLKSGLCKPKGRRKQLTFLDAGCGVGATVCIARKMGFDSKGIEINPDLIKISSLIFNKKERVEEGDILEYKKYNKFDVIYYYCPFEDSTLERKFERIVESKIRRGGVIIANMRAHQSYNKKEFEMHTDVFGATILKKREVKKCGFLRNAMKSLVKN